ncbi:MAG TPA: BrxE family protein [Tepidisphaeraceae bacterium]|jgi:hypothetical protein|nr:BrxE family protein [Tepidisphaeraceae bacterium]
MTQEIIEAIVRLRAAVGFLGEQGPAKRWPSAFFAPSSRSFLSPLFPRTLVLSQLRGVIAAAARVHDERIGVGDVYHLFRLPEEIEQSTHQFMSMPQAEAVLASSSFDAKSASATLKQLAAKESLKTVGPARIGPTKEMDQVAVWQKVAALYGFGFRNETEVYPFFSAK